LEWKREAKETDSLGGRILKLILEQQNGMKWNGLIWLRTAER